MYNFKKENILNNLNNTFFYNVSVSGRFITANYSNEIKGYGKHNKVIITYVDKDLSNSHISVEDRGCDYNYFVLSMVDYIIDDSTTEVTTPIEVIFDINSKPDESLIK